LHSLKFHRLHSLEDVIAQIVEFVKVEALVRLWGGNRAWRIGVESGVEVNGLDFWEGLGGVTMGRRVGEVVGTNHSVIPCSLR